MNKFVQLLLAFSFIFISCEHQMPLKQGKSEIEEYLKDNYKGQFLIDSICKHFSRDLFNQQVGFKVWLRDNDNNRFGPIFFQKNKYQGGWITYGGTSVLTEYKKVYNGPKSQYDNGPTKQSR
ncbi:hypothetical protein GA0116948_1372 [Chitinophaga costaii]|uniref:Lipoprotein n=1 Tax=Chitinophaga costaii TaxID=1335309 RepID=A0A1C4G983_9BACT|nr:hypothetical protein [Chitinophaga costaii]PUZ19708.1 hypothetical protein DCM91_20285 [Chitinophaga costaii]SCC64778.1 hypothetical protein GA0116948_1372 [Chitinophaga costaii]